MDLRFMKKNLSVVDILGFLEPSLNGQISTTKKFTSSQRSNRFFGSKIVPTSQAI